MNRFVNSHLIQFCPETNISRGSVPGVILILWVPYPIFSKPRVSEPDSILTLWGVLRLSSQCMWFISVLGEPWSLWLWIFPRGHPNESIPFTCCWSNFFPQLERLAHRMLLTCWFEVTLILIGPKMQNLYGHWLKIK